MKYYEQILFAFVFGITLYFASQHTDNSETNYKLGIVGACFVFVAEGTLKNSKGLFLKPSEAFWRGVLRFCIIYMGILVFLSFQNSNDARQLFKHLYPDLGQPIPHHMHTYDDNCELQWDNIVDNFDHYYAIHLINWFIITIIVRDAWILHAWSILHEIIELSAQHILPHFRECWWDHIILDIIFSNTVSISIGLMVIKFTGLQEYDWLGRKGTKNFTQWKIWSCHRRYGIFIGFWLIIIINFLCGFFMINSLWIPPKNWINIYRLLVWFLLSNLAFKEAYSDIETWGTQKRVENPISGKCRWVTFFICFSETFVSYKFSGDAGNMLDNPTPLYISVPWAVVIIASGLYYLFLRFKPNPTKKYPLECYQKQESEKSNKIIIPKDKKEILSNEKKKEKSSQRLH